MLPSKSPLPSPVSAKPQKKKKVTLHVSPTPGAGTLPRGAPSSASSSSAGTVRSAPAASMSLTPQLRSDVNAALLAGGGADRIHSTLLHHLQSANWAANVRALCLETLRDPTSSVTTYPQLMRRVREEIRAQRGAAGGANNGDALEGAGGKSVAIPAAVLEKGMVVVREVLGEVVEVAGG